MNEPEEFHKRFIKNSIKMKSSLKWIHIYKDDKTIYFLTDGLITPRIKSKLEKLYSKNPLEKVFVSIVANRNFGENDEMLLDTYVWISSEPEHTINYPSSPVLYLKNRKKNV